MDLPVALPVGVRVERHRLRLARALAVQLVEILTRWHRRGTPGRGRVRIPSVPGTRGTRRELITRGSSSTISVLVEVVNAVRGAFPTCLRRGAAAGVSHRVQELERRAWAAGGPSNNLLYPINKQCLPPGGEHLRF